MSRRDRKDESSRREEAPKPRMSTFFVPGLGIDREVITTDICRYLGNDALVRPGVYNNPNTGDAKQGYFITAYRALTTEQLADLKADSARWDAERRRNPSANRPQAGGISQRDSPDTYVRQSNMNPAADYRASMTHRQQLGSREEAYPDREPPRMGAEQPQYAPPGYGAQGGGYNPRPPQDSYMEGNYVTYGRPQAAEVEYRTAQPAPQPPNDSNPRYGYPPPQSGRGLPPSNYPPSGYPYDSGPATSPPISAGPRQAPPGMGAYDYGSQPQDPRYGRNPLAAQPGAEENYADYDEDETMDDPPYPPPQVSRPARDPRDTRNTTPPTTKSRHHSSRHDRDGRR